MNLNQTYLIIISLLFLFSFIGRLITKKRVEKMLNEFIPFLTDTKMTNKFLLQRLYLDGIYQNRNVQIYCGFGSRLAVTTKLSTQPSKSFLPRLKRAQWPGREITKGYYLLEWSVRSKREHLVETSVRYYSQKVFFFKFKLPQPPQQILDGLIEACNKVEQEK